MKKIILFVMLLLCVNVALAALPSTFNPFTSKLDFYGVDSKVADTCVTGEISSWNGTKFTCVVGGNVTGMASWTVSNKTSSTAISDSEILNFTGGSGIRVGLSNNEITITSTVVDTDTNDSARVNSINDSLIIQTAIIDNVNASVNLFQPSAYTNISALQAKPDATGSWINSTIRASTHLNVTTGGQLLVNNSGGQGYAEVRGSSAKFVLNETDYELASWSFLVSFADFFFKQETASNRSFNIRGSDNKDRLRVNLANNVTTINDTLQVTNLTSANCDLKADTSGFIYCGTDALGGGAGVDNGIFLDAGFNLTNKIGLQNSTLLSCSNITGAASDLCTITPGGGSGDGTGGWTNYSNVIITNNSDSVVKITGALCLNAEDGTHIAPCRERWGDQENQRKFMSIQMDPFLVSGAETGEYGHWGWTSAVLGTGTDITDSDSPTVDALGTISLGTGTLATGQARLSTGTGGIWLNGSSGITGWFTRVYFDNIGRDAQNYTAFIGMSDGTLNVMGVDSIIAVYNSSESQYWQFATCSNSACTKNISDYQVNATKWYDLEAQVYNNTLAVLYINGVNAVNLTNNIPSGSTRAFPAGRLQINKTAGTTERRMYVDYYGVYRVFDAPRW